MVYKLFLGLILFFLGCANGKPAPHTSKPQILVSIAPYRYIVEQIAGPDVEVSTIVPQNADPHSFEPTSRQVADLNRGTIWFLIGEPFEKKMVPVLKERNPRLAIVDLLDGIDLHEEGCHCCDDHHDRHVWLSPKHTAAQADVIERALSAAFPDKKGLFQKNNDELKRKLMQLDVEIEAMLAPVKNRAILVSHPAFAYFCKDYNFEQVSVEFEGKDPRPKHLEQILKKTVALSIAMPQYNNKGTELISQKMNIPMHYIDPYSDDYFNTMRELAELLCTMK